MADTPNVRQVRQDGPRHLTVIVDDAGTATTDVVEAIAALGGEVATVREIHPSFDDVFAALVARDVAARDAAAREAETSETAEAAA